MMAVSMTATKAKSGSAQTAPTGLRVSEKLLATYRQLQDRLADPQLDKLGRDQVAERLRSKILQSCELYPWTPAEVLDWTWSWLHALAYGAEAKTRKCHGFYGPIRNIGPMLRYTDIEELIEELDADDQQRCRDLR